MAFKDYLEAVLRGGLPAILDNPNAAPSVQGNAMPEQTAPVAGVNDLDHTFTLKSVFTPTRVAYGVGALLVIAGLAWALRKR